MTSRLHRPWIFSTRSIVFSRVLPPAPYVTEQKPGLSLLMFSISLKRLSSPFSVFGGKNSTDSVKPGRAYRSANFTRVLDDYLRRSAISSTMFCHGQLAGRWRTRVLCRLGVLYTIAGSDRIAARSGFRSDERPQ